jgi:hypothetical protein
MGELPPLKIVLSKTALSQGFTSHDASARFPVAEDDIAAVSWCFLDNRIAG